jgi:hypothetical protein
MTPIGAAVFEADQRDFSHRLTRPCESEQKS